MAEQKLAPPADRFRELFETSLDAILEVDREGIIGLASEEAARLFGYTHDELIGKPIDDLVPQRFRPRHAEYRNGYAAAPRRRPMGSNLDLWARRADGSEFPVDIKLGPVGSGEDSRITCVVRDITERRDAQNRIRDLNLILEQRNCEVERANQMKSEFLAGMSHELRTPLHTIIGFAELLREQNAGELNAKQTRYTDHILNGSRHLLALINDILDLSRIEAGRTEVLPVVFSAAEAIEEALTTIRPTADAKKITLRGETSDAPPIRADRQHVRQILLNLLGNAVKFTPPRGEIRVQASAGPGCCAFVVTDTGIGIAPGELQKIFDSFYQATPPSGGLKEGTGLGLAISKRLVELNQGSIHVVSEPGKGSQFTVELPLAGGE